MAIFDILKSAAETLRKADKIEEYRQILDAQKELSEMQKKISDLEEENKKLKEKFKIKEALIYENNAYWIKKADESKDGPFCSRCWDKNNELIRMHPRPNAAFSQCPECQNMVQIGVDHSPYKPRIIRGIGI